MKPPETHKNVPIVELERDYRPPKRGARLWMERPGDWLLVTATGKRDRDETVEVNHKHGYHNRGGSSKYRGVLKSKKSANWTVQHGGRQLGTYRTELDAARA